MKKLNNIPIVDDDEISSFLIESTLNEINIVDHVDKVYNGREAINFLAAHCGSSPDQEAEYCPSLVLLDLNMPVMNGFEFLEEFTKKYASLKDKVHILILTSSLAPNDLDKAKNYHLAGYLSKPLGKKDLLPILEKL